METIHTRIWQEEAEPDNSFAAATCHCHGYDVYGDLLVHASWIEYLFLLFRGEAPSTQQARLLEGLAIALANPGPRDAAVHAAMCGGVGGSTSASCLMAALAVGAGASGGAREMRLAMEDWLACGTDLALWQTGLAANPVADPADVWPAPGHPAGFDPHGVRCATPVRQTLAYLAGLGYGTAQDCAPSLAWLQANRASLESAAGLPLAMHGVAAAALRDLGFSPAQGEMLHLLLRLPGAAVHALEQKDYGHKNFPFFRIELENDPGPANTSHAGDAA
ncbi:MAG: citryl-CoA lyase [Gallionellales bacterium RIFCSPLOWO2_02_FULL_57_47]|nr:MAG: citryl-CoA lyase [Gallionellales bacterium RIFCSPLOWO2_02_FULL_57_47]OGT11733.1 MAG: citryl-CoA lyase [Gallionellales bacterium RIFCSPHIGHO2_02_FULL_57_16]